MGVLLSVLYLAVTYVTIKLRKLMTVHGIDAYIISNFWRTLFAMVIAWFIVPPTSRYVVGLGMTLVYVVVYTLTTKIKHTAQCEADKRDATVSYIYGALGSIVVGFVYAKQFPSVYTLLGMLVIFMLGTYMLLHCKGYRRHLINYVAIATLYKFLLVPLTVTGYAGIAGVVSCGINLGKTKTKWFRGKGFVLLVLSQTAITLIMYVAPVVLKGTDILMFYTLASLDIVVVKLGFATSIKHLNRVHFMLVCIVAGILYTL